MAAQNDTPSLGAQLELAIRKKRTSQTAVAHKAGLTVSYVGKILSGAIRRPNDRNLRKLEDALGLRHGHFKIPAQPKESADDLLRQILRRLESLEASVDEVAQDTAESLARLAGAIDGLSAQRPGVKRSGRRSR